MTDFDNLLKAYTECFEKNQPEILTVEVKPSSPLWKYIKDSEEPVTLDSIMCKELSDECRQYLNHIVANNCGEI